jgi:hypothetical protein
MWIFKIWTLRLIFFEKNEMAWTYNIQVETKNTYEISGWKVSVNDTILRPKLDGINLNSTEIAQNMVHRWYVVKSDSVNSRNTDTLSLLKQKINKYVKRM